MAAAEDAPDRVRALTLELDELALASWAAECDELDSAEARLAGEIRATVRQLLAAGYDPGMALALGLRLTIAHESGADELRLLVLRPSA